MSAELVKQKQASWSNYAVTLHNAETELQLLASQAIGTLSQLPMDFEAVPQAEEKLKAAKKLQNDLKAKRLEVVKPLAAVMDRFMEPEKSMTEPIMLMERAIIDRKKEHEQEKAKVQLRLNELKQFEQHYSNKVADYEARAKSYIETTIQKAYEYALGAGNVTIENRESYIEKVIATRATIEVFEAMIDPNAMPTQYITAEEKVEIMSKFTVVSGAIFVDDFKSKMISKFLNYDLDVKNKEIAIKRAQDEAKAQQEEIDRKKAEAEAIAQIQANAQPLELEIETTKALKKAYEVDMEETFENAMMILAAFQANVARCKDKTTTKKWFGFSADSAAKALAKVKSEDNSFAPVGITFKEVAKL